MEKLSCRNPNQDLLERIREVSLQTIGAREETRTSRNMACFIVRPDGSFSDVGGAETWVDASERDVKVMVATPGSQSVKVPGRGDSVSYDVELVSRERLLDDARGRLAAAAEVLVCAGIDPERPCRIIWPQKHDLAGHQTELFMFNGELRKKRVLEKVPRRPTLGKIAALD